MDEHSYTFRKYLLETEATYVVRDDALLIRRGDREERILLADIRRVQLRDDGPFDGVRMYSCVIKTARGKIVIRSAHFVRLGQFESRAAEYRGFVRALHDALKAHADQVQFIQGCRLMHLTAAAIMVLIPLLILAAAAAIYLTPGHAGGLFLKVLILAGMAPAMLQILRRGRPTSYNVAHMPGELVP